MLHVLSWWLLIQVLGLVALPLAYRLFKWLPGRGYAFAKPLGLLLTSYVLWLGASLGYLRNTLGGALAAIAVTTALSITIYVRREEAGPSLMAFLREHRRLVLTVEILFTVGFLAWAGLRAYAPDKIMHSGGEKFMEIAFLNSILQSPTFPPRDPWLSGFAISYYYFGYVMMALLTTLSGVLPGVGFELYDALMFALTLTGAFGVVYGLVAGSVRPRANQGQAVRYGLLGSLFVAVLGNLEGVLEALYARGLLPDAFWRWIDIPDLVEVGRVTGNWYPGNGWWWWRASRVIRDRNLLGEPMPLNPIDEFPFFSFLLGDNHPHVLALPFVLLAVALAFNVLRRQRRRVADHGSAASRGGWENPAASIGGGQGTAPSRGGWENTTASGGRTQDSAAGGEGSRNTAATEWAEENTPASGPAGGQAAASAPARWHPSRRLRTGLVGYVLDGDWVLFILYGLGLGSLGFLNTWDFPIYVGLTVLAYAVGRYVAAEEPLTETLKRAVVLGVSLTLVGVLLYLPFYVGFMSQAGGIVPYLLAPTRLAQYLVMFGPFTFVAASFVLTRLLRAGDGASVWGYLARAWGLAAAAPLVVLGLALAGLWLTEPGRETLQRLLTDPRVQQAVGASRLAPALRAIVVARLRDPWLFLVLSLLMSGVAVSILQPWKRRDDPIPSVDSGPARGEASPLFASLLFLCGLGLTFVVEFVYLRDSFGVRMNTIFKFYYQAWVMLGCASAFGIWWILGEIRGQFAPLLRALFVAATVLLTSAGLVYTVMASYSRVDGFQQPPNLNGAINIARAHPDDWAAIEWLRDNAEGGSVILEAPGKSYNYEGRISAFTGRPAVLGWALHESQWRGSYDEQGRREPDIAAIYTTQDGVQAMALLRKWQVDYVVVGPPERRYVDETCAGSERACNSTQSLRKFRNLLEPVFEQGETTVYRVPEA